MKQIALLLLLALAGAPSVHAAAKRAPNFVIIFCDDLGYADVGCFGAKGYATPNLDRMARQGIKFTNFHVASAVCSASRAALLTGCYNTRVGLRGALGPGSRIGIHANEMTLAELVKQKGYATAIFGKWHLGDAPEFLPPNHGFDEYFGLPYSNDMWPYHPGVRHLPMDQRVKRWRHLPLLEGTTVINDRVSPKDQEGLTTWYTRRAVGFIEQHRDEPFLLYVPHSMPHVPLYVSDKSRGKTARGLYGDVISEIDWSVGEILAALKRHDLERDTLVIFTSDNGPWLSYGEHSGVAEPLREGKGTSWEGGVRVPFIARWPGRIPAGGVTDEPAMTIDLFATIAGLTGAPLPAHKIDGRSIWPLLSGQKGAVSPQEAYYIYYANDELQAVISGRWKLVFPHRYRTLAGRPGGRDGLPVNYETRESELELFDLKGDIAESRNVIATYPDVARRLEALAEKAREDLGDGLQKRPGNGVRPAGKLAPKQAAVANRGPGL